MGNLVIGVDSSTQSTKAIAWNNRGTLIAEGRCDIPLLNPSLNKFEQNTNDWWNAFCVSTKSLTNKIDIDEVDGLAISNQRETLAFLDGEGNSIYPAIVWMDKRATKEVEELNSLVGENKIHEITGRPKDTCPCVYRILWLKNNEPKIFDKVKCFADVQTFLVHKLTGHFNTGWISSDPHGMFDVVNKKWSNEIIQHLKIDESQLPKTYAPGTLIGNISDEASKVCGLKAGLPIYAAGGDGQLAGLGTNCTKSNRAYVNLGTAVVSGVWSKEYVVSHAWRTEIAAQGEGYILENCLLSGAILINWFVDQFVTGNRKDKNFFTKLEEKVSKIPIGSEGLITQPYWSGVMDPYWDTSARGIIVGLNLSHSQIHLYRSILEGLTLDQVLGTKTLENEAGLNINEYLVIGGGANSPIWRQMLADASGKNVLVSSTIEASSLGAAMISAYGSGWFDSIEEAAKMMSSNTTLIEPDFSKKQQYEDLLDIYKLIYDSNSKINKQLIKFTERFNK